jgi:allantoicase
MTAFTDLIDLASERTGGAAILANDEFFAPKENLLKPGRGEWREGAYTDRGKWMDGWETRRRREPGHDWCIVRLGLPGIIRGVDVDTNHFKGNYPEACSIDACFREGNTAEADLLDPALCWEELLPKSALKGHAQNLFPIAGGRLFTHVRLRIYPDGGVARLRVYGEVVPDWGRLARAGGWIDLAAVENGGAVIGASDMFFGSRHNMIMPGRAAHMGEGWETRRKRDLSGHDWAIVRLGCEGELRRIEVDTNHFKGNFPESCAIDGLWADPDEPLEAIAREDRRWEEVLPRAKLCAHARHFFEDELRPSRPFTHVRLRIFPDGGVSRLRLHGVPSAAGLARAVLARLNALVEPAAVSELSKCCGARRWALEMARRRPFRDREALLSAADEVWGGLGREDRLEAFRAHPRIGSPRDVAAQGAATRAWAEREQAGTSEASEGTLAALAEGNRAYEERFGHIYIVCATGKTASEMLGDLRARLANDPETEERVAASEQAKITRIRLEKLLAPGTSG